MSFNSIKFIVFLFVSVVIYYLVDKKYRKIWLLASSVIFYLFWGIMFMPIRTSYGACWNMFYCEDINSIDSLVLGSSVEYCDVNPFVMEQTSKESTYVLAGPELTSSLTYYYLIEALKTQSPKTVYLELTGFLFNEYEAYSKVNVGYMKWSKNRINAIFNGTEKSLWPELLFPIIAYHGSQEGVSVKNIFFGRTDNVKDPNKGYTGMDASIPFNNRQIRNYDLSNKEYKLNLFYLEKIIDVCEDNNIILNAFIAPQAEYPSENQLEGIIDCCTENEIGIVNFNCEDDYNSIGLDLSSDYYDFMHLNKDGAEKFSKVLASSF